MNAVSEPEKKAERAKQIIKSARYIVSVFTIYHHPALGYGFRTL